LLFFDERHTNKNENKYKDTDTDTTHKIYKTAESVERRAVCGEQTKPHSAHINKNTASVHITAAAAAAAVAAGPPHTYNTHTHLMPLCGARTHTLKQNGEETYSHSHRPHHIHMHRVSVQADQTTTRWRRRPHAVKGNSKLKYSKNTFSLGPNSCCCRSRRTSQLRQRRCWSCFDALCI